MSEITSTTISITVIPKSSRSAIMIKDDGVRVYLNSPPVDGKANSECIKLFSKKLRIPKSSITIARGEKGRKKELRIENLTTAEVMERL